MDQKNASLLNSYALFMDNLSSHRTKNVIFKNHYSPTFINFKVIVYLRDHFDQVIFNVVRSPNFNPIEGIFAKIKHDFR